MHDATLESRRDKIKLYTYSIFDLFIFYRVYIITYKLLVARHYGKVNDNVVYSVDLDTTFAFYRILQSRVARLHDGNLYRCQGHSRITKTSVWRIDGSLAWLWHRGVSIDRSGNSKGRPPRWAIRTPIGSPYLM